jgi:hypothetical protein
MSRFEKKIPNEASECQRDAGSSPLQVVAMPVGPTGGESPQARASRSAPSPVRTEANDATRIGRRRKTRS